MSRYDFFRRRIAPIAFFFAIVLVAKDACDKSHRTHTNVELVFGAAKPTVREVNIDVVVAGDTIAQFRRTALPGSTIGPCRFPLSLERDEGELRIVVDHGATKQRLTRRFHTIEGSTTFVEIPDP